MPVTFWEMRLAVPRKLAHNGHNGFVLDAVMAACEVALPQQLTRCAVGKMGSNRAWHRRDSARELRCRA